MPLVPIGSHRKSERYNIIYESDHQIHFNGNFANLRGKTLPSIDKEL
jgi:hypothetical protein